MIISMVAMAVVKAIFDDNLSRVAADNWLLTTTTTIMMMIIMDVTKMMLMMIIGQALLSLECSSAVSSLP